MGPLPPDTLAFPCQTPHISPSVLRRSTQYQHSQVWQRSPALHLPWLLTLGCAIYAGVYRGPRLQQWLQNPFDFLALGPRATLGVLSSLADLPNTL